MTILPTHKKKRERDGSQKPAHSSSSTEHRQNLVIGGQGSGPVRRIRKSPRPNEKGIPPIKRSLLSSPVHGHPLSSPLSSPRNHRIVEDSSKSNHLIQASSSSNQNNSDDEYDMEMARDEAMEREFAERLRGRGLIIKEMVGDGACMFRAIAEQVYGDQEMHGQIRKLCMDYMATNRDYYSDFITEDFDSYIRRKRDNTVHGNHVELQAISEMFARPVEVYQNSDEPINTLLPRGSTREGEASSSSIQQNPPLRLSYHGAVHYNAIVDPQGATIGVGLGLPGMIPGGADRSLIKNAIEKSERELIEEAMLKDKINMTDWQRTQADMEDQITRESYLSYLKEMEEEKEKGKKKEDDIPSTSGITDSKNEKPGLYEELLAAQSLEWDAYNDDVAITEALLLSQQDFMSSQQSASSSSSK